MRESLVPYVTVFIVFFVGILCISYCLAHESMQTTNQSNADSVESAQKNTKIKSPTVANNWKIDEIIVVNWFFNFCSLGFPYSCRASLSSFLFPERYITSPPIPTFPFRTEAFLVYFLKSFFNFSRVIFNKTVKGLWVRIDCKQNWHVLSYNMTESKMCECGFSKSTRTMERKVVVYYVVDVSYTLMFPIALSGIAFVTKYIKYVWIIRCIFQFVSFGIIAFVCYFLFVFVYCWLYAAVKWSLYG